MLKLQKLNRRISERQQQNKGMLSRWRRRHSGEGERETKRQCIICIKHVNFWRERTKAQAAAKVFIKSLIWIIFNHSRLILMWSFSIFIVPVLSPRSHFIIIKIRARRLNCAVPQFIFYPASIIDEIIDLNLMNQTNTFRVKKRN